MMRRNLGKTSLKCKRSNGNSMRDYDNLSPELRAWLASAALPWRPRSVQRAFNQAIARTQDKAHALAELDRMQDRLVAKDVCKVWGQDHPNANCNLRR